MTSASTDRACTIDRSSVPIGWPVNAGTSSCSPACTGSDIERQLHGLGFPAEAVVAADPNAFAEVFATLTARKRASQPVSLDDGTTVLARDLPNVLVLSSQMLSDQHEAGAAALATFGTYPQNRLINLCRLPANRPWATDAIVLPTDADAATAAIVRELGSRGLQRAWSCR